MSDMDRILDIWDEELASIVEIERVGHRRRILLSVAGPAALHKRCENKKVGAKSSSEAVVKCEAHRKKSLTGETAPPPETKRLSASGSDLGLGSSSERRYTSTSSASESSDKPPTPSR